MQWNKKKKPRLVSKMFEKRHGLVSSRRFFSRRDQIHVLSGKNWDENFTSWIRTVEPWNNILPNTHESRKPHWWQDYESSDLQELSTWPSLASEGISIWFGCARRSVTCWIARPVKSFKKNITRRLQLINTGVNLERSINGHIIIIIMNGHIIIII